MAVKRLIRAQLGINSNFQKAINLSSVTEALFVHLLLRKIAKRNTGITLRSHLI